MPSFSSFFKKDDESKCPQSANKEHCFHTRRTYKVKLKNPRCMESNLRMYRWKDEIGLPWAHIKIVKSCCFCQKEIIINDRTSAGYDPKSIDYLNALADWEE